MLAMSSLLGKCRAGAPIRNALNPLAAKPAPLAGPGQAGHLSRPVRSAAAARSVRLQADAQSSSTARPARRSLSGRAVRVHQGNARSCSAPRTNSRSTGRSGAWVSELLPHFSEMVDEMAIVKSMYTDQFNHAPAEMLLYTGNQRPGYASMGSWITYGLGSESAESARLCRAGLRRHRSHRRQEPVGQRLSAQRLPGRAVPQQGRADSVRFQSQGDGPRRRGARASMR